MGSVVARTTIWSKKALMILDSFGTCSIPGLCSFVLGSHVQFVSQPS